jgi:NitT/TauT family transport system ATP-binding protein
MRDTIPDDSPIRAGVHVPSVESERWPSARYAADTPVVELRGVSQSFRDRVSKKERLVLQDVSLSVAAGEVVALIGPSGCGKTTVLNCVAGLLSPTAGTVAFQGATVSGIQAPNIAYMMARDALFPWRTALQNVQLSLEVARAKEKNIDAKARNALKLVGLAGFEHHFPTQLSHGMRQRVALARTLAVGASTWVMDEPFSALDAFTRASIHSLFSEIREAEGKTVLLVTHDLAEAILLADRIAVMGTRPGRIKQIYTVPFPRPRHLMELQGAQEFGSLYAQLWNDLRVEIVPDVDDLPHG